MLTYLPYRDFRQTAESLSNFHLVDAVQTALVVICSIHETNDPTDRGVLDRPVGKMWSGYEPQLAEYGIVTSAVAMQREVCARHLPGDIEQQFIYHLHLSVSGDSDIAPPPWLGKPGFHYSHQSNLMRLDRGHYLPIFGSAVPDDLPLYWPVD